MLAKCFWGCVGNGVALILTFDAGPCCCSILCNSDDFFGEVKDPLTDALFLWTPRRFAPVRVSCGVGLATPSWFAVFSFILMPKDDSGSPELRMTDALFFVLKRADACATAKESLLLPSGGEELLCALPYTIKKWCTRYSTRYCVSRARYAQLEVR